MDLRQRTAAAWPQIRAVLLALHVLAIVLLSFPGSSKLGDRNRWKEHRTQAQLALWGGRLRSWGLDLSDAELEAKLWSLAQSYLGVRAYVTAPFEPYGHVAPQNWGMFKAPQRSTFGLAIDIEDRDGWRVIYVSRSGEYDYLGRLLENNRFRKQIGRVAYDKPFFKELARWLAERALVDFPGAKRVRVRIERVTSLTPEEARAGAIAPRSTESEHVFSREQEL